MQNLATTVQFDQVASEYSTLIQAAGMRVGIIDVCRRDASTPDDLRRSLVRQLQAALPKSVPVSVRADASRLPNAEFVMTEKRVKAAVIEAAHQSPELRPVVSVDRAGREQIEFYGQKRSWMAAYQAPAMLTKAIDGVPVRLPTVLS